MTSVEPVLSERWEHAVWALLRQLAWPSSLVSEVPLLEGMCDSDTAVRQDEWHLLTLRSSGPSSVTHVES